MNKQTLAAAALSTVAVLGLGGTAMNAWADTQTPAPAPTQATTATAAGQQSGQPTGQPSGAPDQGSQKQGPGGHDAPGQHTEVTGDELTKVTDAVKAKDGAFTVEKVLKDADGSYDVLGTKDGNRAGYEVSADLATITEHLGGPGGPGGHDGKGGPGRGGQDTPVTGDEASKAIAAVNAKFPGNTLDTVQKDPDGSYDVLGKNAEGHEVAYDVSADLQTITERPAR